MIRSTIALLLTDTDAARVWFNGLQVASKLADDAAHIGLMRLMSAASRIDVDTEPCRECGSPGGTHQDCDAPSLGRMTRTERLTYFESDA